jgi:hypothetical protein
VSRRLRLSVGAALAFAVAGLGAAMAYAAFVATTANSGNSFQAAACFSTQRMATGSYTGNAPTDNRTISVGFQPNFVIVKADTAQIAIARTSSMSGDASKPMAGATGLVADRIQSLTASGFTVGTNAQVNANGTIYRWVAFKSGCGTLEVGSYAGNGGASQAITGAGFQPELAMLMPGAANRSTQRYSGMTTTFRFDGGTGIANVVNSLDADGFTVGNAPEANTNGTTYHYVAFNDVAGSVVKSNYIGNGVDNRNIGGVGFQPDYVMIRANDTATARSGQHLPASLSGGNSLFWANTANTNNGIQALQAGGFQVGTDASVNAGPSGPTYHYIAFKNTGGGCALPGPRTVQASVDAWLNEASAATNLGTDNVLKVTSKSPADDTRAVVQFNLPPVPSGCSVTGATLRMYNKSPISGRTLEALANATAWTENGVNWSNQPTTTGSAATATTPASAGWMQWDVTAHVQAMYAGSNYGLKVKDQSENAAGFEQQFDSREASTNRPELVVTIG